MAVKVVEDWLNACAGCEMSILNIGDALLDILPLLEFTHITALVDHKFFGQLGDQTAMEVPESVVGIVTGGVRNDEQKHEVEEIRKKVKVLMGDFGRPALNGNGRVVGVANSGNKATGVSTYTPTAFYYSWIFGQPYSGYHICGWYEIGAQRSHQPGSQPWCPEGAFLTQFDLDSDTRLPPQDSPIVGRAKCCWVSGFPAASWSSCVWNRVGIQSHQQGPSWCSPGSFMTQFDLDGGQGFNGHDAPIVGQAYCCAIHSFRIHQWQRCEWVEVGFQKSHEMNHDWCPDGTFLTHSISTATRAAGRVIARSTSSAFMGSTSRVLRAIGRQRQGGAMDDHKSRRAA